MEVSTDGFVGRYPILLEVEEVVSGGNNWVTKRDDRAFHNGGLSSDTILLSVQE